MRRQFRTACQYGSRCCFNSKIHGGSSETQAFRFFGGAEDFGEASSVVPRVSSGKLMKSSMPTSGLGHVTTLFITFPSSPPVVFRVPNIHLSLSKVARKQLTCPSIFGVN